MEQQQLFYVVFKSLHKLVEVLKLSNINYHACENCHFKSVIYKKWIKLLSAFCPQRLFVCFIWFLQ
jgi:hypothetical protein